MTQIQGNVLPSAGPASEAYAIIAGVHRQLSVSPHAPTLRLRIAREYARLGLVRPARDLLSSIPENHASAQRFNPDEEGSDAASEAGRMSRALAGRPDGRVPWSRYATRFERNLQALESRNVDVTGIRRAWRASHRQFELYEDACGNEQVRWIEPSGWRWIPDLADHRAEADRHPLPPDIGNAFPGPYLFEGLDLGHLFERIYDRTLNSFLRHSSALYVVEPDAALLSIALHLRDWSDRLADERLFLFTGEGAAQRFVDLLRANVDLPVPAHAFTLGRFRLGPSPGAVAAAQTVLAEREQAALQSWEALQRQYAGRDVSYWARRFDEALSGKGAPLRILSAVSVHTTFLQHSVRDAQRAFESLGHTCEVLKERRPHEVVGLATYHDTIRRLDPDVFFNLDHLRPEFGQIVPENLPILTWDQDQLPHVFTDENLRQVARHDFLTGCSKTRWLMAGCDPRQFLSAIVPTCPEQFGGEPLTEEERTRYACDVSYVSHASQTPRAFHEEERKKAGDPRLAHLLDELYELALVELAQARTMHSGLPRLILREATRRTGISVDEAGARQLCGWYLWRLGDRIFRHEALEWVAAWARRARRRFRIYGNGWDRHPTLAEFAAGPAENGRELIGVYRASRINLQLMPAGFIHQRALDGLAAGGFFLSRRVPHDLMSGTLRQLAARLDALNLHTMRDVLACEDGELWENLRTFCGRGLDDVDPGDDYIVANLRMAAELPYPDEAFPGFADLVFDSAEEFERVAERFLEGEALRQEIVHRMREVVIERFSYKAQMGKFLEEMGKYLRQVVEQS
ncbi:MAG: glycosyltransferase family 1 protein [Phycisphaerae bacterium]|nr:glycosyltransferase family 1 protein [Phycisphaerae bacterium]